MMGEGQNIASTQCFERSADNGGNLARLKRRPFPLLGLDEGKHAAESGLDLKAYAARVGKGYENLKIKLRAYRVIAGYTCTTELRDQWRNLAEIHAAANATANIRGATTCATCARRYSNR